jgi:hypothetical protein
VKICCEELWWPTASPKKMSRQASPQASTTSKDMGEAKIIDGEALITLEKHL